jgi:UDP-2-acetamido-2,6-beta-L-arabino-hexul-4-ose reductase
MAERTTIEPVAYPTDARGLVLEPIGADDLPHQKNVHLVLTAPGGIRGNHYHRRGTEISVVLGPALLRYREDGEIRDLLIKEGEAQRVVFPPGVPHALKNPGPGTMVIIAFNTEIHDRENPDVVREVLFDA